MTEYLLFMQRLLLVLLGLVCANYVEAYDFTAKNEDDVVIYYNYNGAIAIVTSGEQQYEGTVRIPATVTNDGITYEVKLIGPKAFFNCGALTSVEIPSSVVAIGSFAFYFCLSLKSIDIPGNVMAIGDRAFAECQNMETIRLSEGLLSIGAWAFENNLKVQSVCIPASVTEIGVSAFSGNNAMTTVSVARGNSFFDSRDDCNAMIETASNMLITGCKTTKIPSDIVTIGNCSFCDCETLASIEIPASVTTIGSSAFSHCQSLESIEIPNSVESIDDNAFMYCSGLKTIRLSEGLSSIGKYAFEGCRELQSVYIPASVKEIGAGVLSENSAMTTITVAPGNKSYDSRKNCNAIIETASNTLISGCQNTRIPHGVVAIGKSAFYGCQNLFLVEIPKTVTSIADYAFSNCGKLKEVVSEIKNPFEIDESVFSSLPEDAVLYVPKGTKEAYESIGGWNIKKSIR